MKSNRFQKQTGAQASVLVVALTIVAVAAVLLASCLIMVQTQTNSVARSQVWNSAIALTEAGLEEGMAEVNSGSPTVGSNAIVTASPWSWTNNLASDGWSTLASGQYSMTRYVSGSNAGSNYFTVTIDVSSGTPTITSTGVAAFTSVLWGSYAGPQPFLAVVGLGTATNNTSIGRKVQIQTVLVPLFSVAILTRSNFNMNGNNTVVDSFDSSSTIYSTGGQWDASKRKANGNVATDSGLIGDVSIGNGNIYGHVYTGPGTAQSAVQVGPNGAVGDLAWNAGSSGIEPNYWAGNFNTAIPDVPTPTFVGGALPAPVSGTITLNGGNYTVTAAGAPSSALLITGPTTLWVQGSFSVPSIIITNNGSLVLYVGRASGSGDSLSLAGNTVYNQHGLAANFELFGLPSLTGISLAGNGGFNGAIYAPEANFTGGGGGNNPLDSSGSLIVNSVKLNGHWNFHYDEHLSSAGASRGWLTKNWTEIKY